MIEPRRTEARDVPRVPGFDIAVGIACLIAALAAGPAFAQPYARFDLPDSARVRAVSAARAEFENAWNALLVAELRASLAKADSAQRLTKLERAVASAEPPALGSRCASAGRRTVQSLSR